MPKSVETGRGTAPVITFEEYEYHRQKNLEWLAGCLQYEGKFYCPACHAKIKATVVMNFFIRNTGPRILLPDEFESDDPEFDVLDMYCRTQVYYCPRCGPKPKPMGPFVARRNTYHHRPH